MRLIHPLHTFVLFALLCLFAGQSVQGEQPVLNNDTIWRSYMVWREYRVGTQTEYRSVGSDALYKKSTPPDDDWTTPNFDDSNWSRTTLPINAGHDGHGNRQVKQLAVLYLRGAFDVTNLDAVKSLKVEGEFRGGIVVYLNGHEVARRHLPDGPLTTETAAEDYPLSTYLLEGNEKRIPPPGERTDNDDIRQRLAQRIRTVEVELPQQHLRKGRNVLSIQLHRAITPEKLPSYAGDRADWATLGLNEFALTAPQATGLNPNVAPPAGLHVWNASPLLAITQDVNFPDPGTELRPIRLTAARNATASGQVVISDRAGISSPISTQTTPLRHESSRGVIAADQIHISYAHQPTSDGRNPHGYIDILSPLVPKDVAAVPVWIVVNVPADVTPGQYTGELTLRVGGRSFEVPIHLRVSEWTAPDPKQFQFMLELLQSPDTSSAYYDVPLYSDAHFKLIESALKLLGQTGNKVAYVTAIRRTHFGNEQAMIHFQEVGGRVVPDFTAMDRYLDLYEKHVGQPRVLGLYVWDNHLKNRGNTPVDEVPITRRDRRGNLEDWSQPMFGREGSHELWQQVIDGVKKRIKDRGWPEEALVLGAAHDGRPDDRTVEFFNKLDPKTTWLMFTHGRGHPRPSDGFVTIDEMRFSYGIYPSQPGPRHNQVYPQKDGIITSGKQDYLKLASLRSYFTNYSPPANYRVLIDRSVRSDYLGLARVGFDYWVVRPGATASMGRGSGALITRYSTSNVLDINLMRDNPRTLTAPGPDGALPTVRFQMFREGAYIAEARLQIENALRNDALAPKISDELRTRAIDALNANLAFTALGEYSWDWYMTQNWQQMNHNLYEVAAELQRLN